MERVRGTCVAIDAWGILLRGPSGSGKSDLALRLIDRGASLVSDDYTELTARNGRLIASAPDAIRGLLEVRGLGILRVSSTATAPVAVAFDLVRPKEAPRMPEPETLDVLGLSVPLFKLDPFEASAEAKVRLAVRLATGGIMSVQ